MYIKHVRARIKLCTNYGQFILLVVCGNKLYLVNTVCNCALTSRANIDSGIEMVDNSDGE
ncbi:hypothetical protein CVS40_11961 [Lucilia cuprina]|nr:hypothetical protein CVS40_11961 [Lucilia cuprina]